MTDLAIGIDLGTTFSCVAVIRNGKVEVIANEQGNFITPSYVAFNQYERMIGDAAKHQLAANASNTIFDVKRLIGRKFNDPIVQKDMKQWPFQVIEKNGMPRIEITYKDEVICFSPEEISSMILSKMREVAESYLNTNIENVVITVPAYFNDSQRSATRDAARIAGLNVLRLINEPNAAAMAYGLSNDTSIAKNILVYDLGGGTFDVSVLNVCNNNFQVKAVGGDTHLGGQDFDNLLMSIFVQDFQRKNQVDISRSKKALRRLRDACERAKRTLSSTTFAFIEIDALFNGIDFVGKISRARFDDICAPLFQSTLTVVQRVLNDAYLRRDEIDTIVLVGGSTRIPKIQLLLQDMFEGKEICKTVNPDEAVAAGAALCAGLIHGNASGGMGNMKLIDVTPLTLGVAEGEDFKWMSSLIKRNSPLPVVREKVFVTTVDDQTSITFPIMQGERPLSKDNFEIGEFTIDDIPTGPAEKEQVVVTFSIDINGILNVTAVSKSNPYATGGITIKNVCGSLTTIEIEKMIADAGKYRQEDHEVRKYYTARTELERYCYELRNRPGMHSIVYEKCDVVIEWLNNCIRPDVIQFQQEKKMLEILSLHNDNENDSDDDGGEPHSKKRFTRSMNVDI